MTRPAGIYVSVPFCRAKCTFCNFASDVFPPERMQVYVDRMLREMDALPQPARHLGLDLPSGADSIYLGGGTPSLLEPQQFQAVFAGLRHHWTLQPDAEITMEAAPGQIPAPLLATALRCGVNRTSLGVQTFVEQEARAVGRLHTGATCRQEIARLRAEGMPRLSLDLIAGLPFQTAASWAQSLEQAVESGVDHISIYMLETDGESRLGTEVERLRATSQLSVLGQHARYSAGAVPSEEACADLYQQACETLAAHGLLQYEISNFARLNAQSAHNRKYWERAPYVGLGLDAHSMLTGARGEVVRFQNADELDVYLRANGPSETLHISRHEAFEETVFLGLRLVEGISVADLARWNAGPMLDALLQRARELAADGLMTVSGDRIALTARGRVLSSAVFGELLTVSV